MSAAIREHPSVVAYMERVCFEVKAAEVHEEIRLEMLSHLEDIVEEKMAREGMAEEEAIACALRQMGDPIAAGRGLHAVHRPKPEWGVMALLAGLIIVAVVAIYVVNLTRGERYEGLWVNQMVYGLAGLACLTVFYFLDYRKLLRWSLPMHAAAVGLHLSLLWIGTTVNGSNHWIVVGAFAFKATAVTPFLFLLAIIGMMHREKDRISNMQSPFRRVVMEAVLYVLIPVVLYAAANDMVHLTIYAIGAITVLMMAGRWRTLGASMLVITVVMFIRFLLDPLRWERLWSRLTGFISREGDSGYMTARAIEAIEQGGMWGQGLRAVYGPLPYPYSDALYAHLVYSLGWVAGSVIAVFSLLFVGRCIRMGMKLKDGYARGIVVGLTAVLGTKLLWNILMCLGLLPISSIPLPIVHVSSITVVELAAIGLMLGAYRRKDMIRKHAIEHSPQSLLR
ncbi:FtsW/RodA/SpoVE family cell cycle protein [Paenibacillus chungangensis]|uniref:FtsW/RodA/SpoVE family cell cycle protein n=1 Tax=Paenibacillus chungangensis TaxID=696535 RepID=A0ABW3HJY6_9BACL